MTAAESTPLDVVVVGAGVAGLETLLGLHDLAGDRVDVTLVDPGDSFVFRPMTVAEPFSAGHAGRYPLADVVERTGARHVRSALAAVDPRGHRIRTTGGAEIPYDALVLTLGGAIAPAFDRALTFDPDDTGQLGGLLRDADEGYARRIAVVVPPGPHWSLPAYELAFLLARQVHGMGIDGLELTLVTPEAEPLALFGGAASEAIAAELREAGVRIETGADAEVRPGHPTTIVMHPGNRTLDVDRVIALPLIRGREIPGIPAGPDGFVDVDEHCRVRGLDDVYAAGDGTDYPIKQGGIAAQQADAVVEHLAARAGAAIEPAPFTPVLRGRLLTGGKGRWLRHKVDDERTQGEVASHTLWWPPSKVAGRWLAPYLAEADEAAQGFVTPPAEGRRVDVTLPRDVGPSGHNLELLGREPS